MAWNAMQEIMQLERNDTDAALEFTQKAMESGQYGFEVSEMVHMLQDDPDALSEQIGQLVRDNPQYKKNNPILADLE